jgi:hypothetical protein
MACDILGASAPTDGLRGAAGPPVEAGAAAPPAVTPENALQVMSF